MSACVLAFDTATEACAIGIGVRIGGTVTALASRDFDAPRAAMSGLLPAVHELLAATQLRPGDLTEVVVGRGPGSFTGVRIGVATAKGVARGLGAPLFGVSTLEAIAWRLPERHTGLVGVIGDAMRGEVYPALFEVGRDAEGAPFVTRLSADTVAKPELASADWAAGIDKPLLLTGNGLAKYADVFLAALGERATLAPSELWPPTGAGLLSAYDAAMSTGTVGDGDPGSVLPVYTRLSDAEETERARLGAVAEPPATGVGGPPSDAADRSGRGGSP